MPALPVREVELRRLAEEAYTRLRQLRQEETQIYDHIRRRNQITLPAGPDDMSSISSLSSDSSDSSDASSMDGQAAEQLSDTQRLMGDLQQRRLSLMRTVAERFDFLENTRVLFPAQVPKVSQLSLVLVTFKRSDPKRFRRNLRVLPSTFDGLLLAIQDSPEFYNNSNNNQLPIEYQLAITLFRVGRFGNGASVPSIGQWAGVSEGVVVISTRRVMAAFLDLHDTVICWPTAEEKVEAKGWVEGASCDGWRGGFCMIDGTTIPLEYKPGLNGEAYFDRKSTYSLNLQVSFCG